MYWFEKGNNQHDFSIRFFHTEYIVTMNGLMIDLRWAVLTLIIPLSYYNYHFHLWVGMTL